MKNAKKKNRPLLAIGVGAMALYGAYSAVCCMKNACVQKVEMLTNILKKKDKKAKKCTEECKCEEDD